MFLKDAQSEQMYILASNYEFLLLFIFDEFTNYFPLWNIFWSCFLYYYLRCRRGKKHFDVRFGLDL